MDERFLIPKPMPTNETETDGSATFSIYLSGSGERLKWSGDFPLPEVGSRVYVVMNHIGWAIVKGYFESAGYVGVMTLAVDPPQWLRAQREKEKRDPKYAKLPRWAKEGIGCEFGAEICLQPSGDP